ncbi:DUF2975 domain-containing protein [Moraxella osloensis]|nr:hypothetical protein [Moraxella osloensis]MBW4008584.1 DUF2975 domain-containing protein [Moraxella osloensis]
MDSLINIATAIGYAYLAILIFAVIMAIIMLVIVFKFFGKVSREMAEMEQRHKEMRERFESKRKHQIKL